ncbi:MAG: DUF502 domain-containing protein [Flavobacteriales bacterium]|jgi:uncharacterized membrane protein|nr:DUF502 domain-containing protein [Flavobacteriales bacterium]MCB0757442.1 DUF502 domain-containing protein [Flavobacteriales bacterium]
MKDKRNIGRLLLGYFFRGLLLIVPVAVIAIVAFEALRWLDQIVQVDIPGLGVVIVLTSIVLIGWLGSTFFYQRMAEIFEDILRRVPFLKTVYDALKDLMEGLVGSKKKFDRPVLITPLDGSGLGQLGFLTQEDLRHIGVGADHVAVYVPYSFAWSGRLFIVPVSCVTPIDAKAAEVMKFILSGGVTRVDEE